MVKVSQRILLISIIVVTTVLLIALISALKLGIFMISMKSFRSQQDTTSVEFWPENQISENELITSLRLLAQRLEHFGYPIFESSVKYETIQLRVHQGLLKDSNVLNALTRRGMFEAKIGNKTVITNKDIEFVCTSTSCARIGPCSKVSNGSVCRYSFSIQISESAASTLAEETSKLSVEDDGALSGLLEILLDGKVMDSLSISKELKGKEIREIVISGASIEQTNKQAEQLALFEMKKLQVYLASESLPSEFRILKK